MFPKPVLKPSDKPTILFVHNAPSTFVKFDQHLLQERWRVREWYQQRRWVDMPALWQAVKESDLVYCWFAGWHSFWPIKLAGLMNKPSFVVTGGYDVAKLPHIGYGSQRGGLRRFIARSVIHNASRLIVFSHSSGNEAIVNAQADASKIDVVPLGLSKVTADPLGERQKLAITVGGIWRENFLRKGLLPFVQAAAHLPDTKFMVVGKWYDDSINHLRQIASPNVEFTGYISDEDLTHLYRRASVYAQASLHEGFGLSVAEAMLNGCIPVVTRTGSLPEVVGKSDLYLNSTNPAQIAEAVQAGHRLSKNRRVEAQQRILSHFSLTRRRHRIHSLVNQYLPQYSPDASIYPAHPNNLSKTI